MRRYWLSLKHAMPTTGINLLLLIFVFGCLGSLAQEAADNSGDAEFCFRLCGTREFDADNRASRPKPCENFFKYVCGNTPAPTEATYDYDEDQNQETFLEKELIETVKATLEATPTEETSNLGDDDEDSLHVLNIAKKLYSACKQEEKGSSPEQLRQAVLQILASFHLENWPSQTGPAATSVKDILKHVGLRPVATVAPVGSEAKQQYLLSVNIAWPRFRLYPHILAASDKHTTKMAAYRRFIRSVVKFFYHREQSSAPFDSDQNNCHEESKQNTDTNDGDEVIRKIVGDIVEVEINLAKIAVAAKKGESRICTMKQWKSELQTEFPILEALRADFRKTGMTLENTDEVIVQLPEYFKSLVSYLKKLRTRKFYNYAGWYMVRDVADGLSCRVRKELNDFLKETTKPGIPVHLNDNACVRKLIGHNGLMHKGVAYLFLKRHFPKSFITETHTIAGNIGTTFSKFITGNSWMNEQTKQKMSTWVSSLSYHIGASDESLNKSVVEKKYDLVTLHQEEPLPQWIWQLRENNFLQKLRLIRTPYEKAKIWLLSPLTTTSTYYQDNTALEMPAGALQPPVYKGDASTSYKLGSMGSLVGEVMARAMTEEGAVWTVRPGTYSWEQTQKQTFKQMLRCLSSQKSSNSIQGQHGKQDPQGEFDRRGGESALRLKLYDHVGLRTSFYAFEHRLSGCATACPRLASKEVKMEHFKGFFEAYAKRHCEANRHRDTEYSVNYALKTFAKFAEAFQCQNKDKMKGKDNCNIVPQAL